MYVARIRASMWGTGRCYAVLRCQRMSIVSLVGRLREDLLRGQWDSVSSYPLSSRCWIRGRGSEKCVRVPVLVTLGVCAHGPLGGARPAPRRVRERDVVDAGAPLGVRTGVPLLAVVDGNPGLAASAAVRPQTALQRCTISRGPAGEGPVLLREELQKDDRR